MTTSSTTSSGESFAAYTVVSSGDNKETLSTNELKSLLEDPRDEVKIDAMKKILFLMLSGDPLPGLLMHVIRFIMPAKSKSLKKLLMLYWELCPKTNPDGKLKQEMVLVCNALRNDLLHPNEFIRGQTLRLLCKLRDSEILEPLVPSVRACLEHKHPYVRKNAVLAVYGIYKSFEVLIPDAPETVYEYINKEQDPSCKRNAFVTLINISMPMAVLYFNSIAPQAANLDEYLQLAIIELIRKDNKGVNADRAKYIQTVFSLLNVSSPSVRYEAASTLVALTSHTSAIKAAVTTYIELAVKESDNNVKLIVLDRIDELREKNDKLLNDMVMDILRVVSSMDLSVRKKALAIAMEMVYSRNVDEVVTFLKKELLKTHDGKYEKVADSVVSVLMDFLTDPNTGSAVDVISFVREVMEKFPRLQSQIIDQLLSNFGDMKTGRVFRGALWIIGEYATELKSIQSSIEEIRKAIGDVPILASEQALRDGQESDVTTPSADTSSKGAPTAGRRVLADGTYATESIFTATSPTSARGKSKADRPPLRALFLEGDFFVGAVLASCLTKLVLRLSKTQPAPSPSYFNSLKTEVMLIITSLIRLGKSEFVTNQIDEDSYERMLTCLRVLSTTRVEGVLEDAFLKGCRSAFSTLVKSRELAQKKNQDKGPSIKAQVDDAISFGFLKGKKSGSDVATLDTLDLSRATGMADRADEYVSKLNRVIALTGHSDPVYAEAYVTVHQYDILLDILIVNQTRDTLQNLTVEFSTLGDLKLVERPAPHTIGPHGFHTVKANIKVSSTETGVIFGNIVYDGKAALESHCVSLADIHIDIMDYIKPATCDETKFRSMWTEFEWENKVNVNTTIGDLKVYLKHILKSTNMNCLTPEHALSGDCGFLSANLYARSIFGEDALANISLEKLTTGKIVGHIRIRSKTQGIALSLGDKITVCQKPGPGQSLPVEEEPNLGVMHHTPHLLTSSA